MLTNGQPSPPLPGGWLSLHALIVAQIARVVKRKNKKFFFEKTLDNTPGLWYNTDRKREGANKMYQIIKNGKVEKWVAVKGGKLVEVDSFNTYSEAHNARERMEEVRGGFFEIVEKKS